MSAFKANKVNHKEKLSKIKVKKTFLSQGQYKTSQKMEIESIFNISKNYSN